MNHMRLHAAGAHAQTPLDCALLPQQADGGDLVDLVEVEPRQRVVVVLQHTATNTQHISPYTQ